MIKRILLAGLIAAAIIPSTYAAYVEVDGIRYEIDDLDETATVTKGNYTGDVVIPESIEVNGTSYIVTSIGSRAFEDCTELHSIGDMPALTSIGEYAFSGCYSLESIGDLPSLTYIYEGTFKDCRNLTTIGDMPSLISLSKLTPYEGSRTINCELGAFTRCYSLQSIGNLPNLTSIEYYSFYQCTSLSSIGDMPSLTSIDNDAFYGCSSLQSIGDMPALTSIGWAAFSNCSSLQSIANMPALTSISFYAFSNCTSLHSIGNMPSLKSIGDNAFSECTSLQSISDLPSLKTIGQCVFYNCTSLQSIGDLPELTSIGFGAFYGSQISDIYLPESINNFDTGAFSYATIHFTSPTPPIFSIYPTNTIFIVPTEAYDAYLEALQGINPSQILSDSFELEYDVETSALDSDSDLLRKINNRGIKDLSYYVVDLKISGTINGYDIMVMRNKFLNLRSLDLSDAIIVSNPYQYVTGCYSEDNIIGSYMFNGLKLLNISLPKGITTIGSYAFANCIFEEIEIPNGVTSIGIFAFENCYNLKEIKLPESLTYIGSYAFWFCSNLEEITIPPHVKTIGRQCFERCSSLKSISLPPTLERIENGAFLDCNNLTEFKIPAGVNYIGDSAIPSSVKDVYTYTIQPTNISQSTFGSNTYLKATLHVPETSQSLYYWNTQWSQFQNIVNFNEPYTYFYLTDQDLVEDPDTPRLEGETDEETGEQKNPDADLGAGSGLVVEGDDSQNLGNVDLEHDGNQSGASIIGGDSSSTETGGNVNIDMLNIKINIEANKWYFFSFPFDIKCEDIKFNGQMVWRYYDGEWRALNGSGAWKDMKDEYLKRGIGYIFQGSKKGTLTLSIPNASFNAQDWKLKLEQNVSDMAQDASWNFIGNPFQSYYELADLGFDGPITWWNPNTKSYEAYSPLDDDMSLYPFMAFFVQKPEGVESVDFDSSCQKTNNQKNKAAAKAAARRRQAARRERAGANDRLLINLNVTDGVNADKTRVVFNSNASFEYEPGLDASKFMSNDAPQIYSIDAQNVRYAINERPVGEKSVKLGFYAPANGVYTIECSRIDCPMTLVDVNLHKNVTLNAGQKYEFIAEKGYDDNRFILTEASGATSVDGIADAESESVFYQMNGIRSNDAGQGLMIELKGNNVKKVIK